MRFSEMKLIVLNDMSFKLVESYWTYGLITPRSFLSHHIMPLTVQKEKSKKNSLPKSQSSSELFIYKCTAL